MVYMKLIVTLGCLAATSLALPTLPPSGASELTVRQCIDWTEYSDDVVPAACGSVTIPDKGLPVRSSTRSITDNGGDAGVGNVEGAPSTQDTSKISRSGLSPTPTDVDVSGSSDKVNSRGLSDHLNPTIPDEDEGEE